MSMSSTTVPACVAGATLAALELGPACAPVAVLPSPPFRASAGEAGQSCTLLAAAVRGGDVAAFSHPSSDPEPVPLAMRGFCSPFGPTARDGVALWPRAPLPPLPTPSPAGERGAGTARCSGCFSMPTAAAAEERPLPVVAPQSAFCAPRTPFPAASPESPDAEPCRSKYICTARPPSPSHSRSRLVAVDVSTPNAAHSSATAVADASEAMAQPAIRREAACPEPCDVLTGLEHQADTTRIQTVRPMLLLHGQTTKPQFELLLTERRGTHNTPSSTAVRSCIWPQ
jgi:hypothetical protein